MRRFLLLAAALATCLALGPPVAAAAKKKGKGRAAISVTKVVGQQLPEAVADTVIPVYSTIAVGKQFKGMRVRDVNVTVQTTGVDQPSGINNPLAAFDLEARITAPGGTTTTLFGPFDLSGNNVGPFTLDDEARLLPSGGPRVDPDALYDPYIGSAVPSDPLAVLDGGPATGTWTLALTDFPFFFGVGGTNTFVQWKLDVTVGRPFKTK
jgi:hypothetical protein